MELGDGLMLETPDWLESLVERVADCMEGHGPAGSVQYRCWTEEEEDEELWEILVYPTPIELVGGAVDGAVVAPGFTLDLQDLSSLFDRVDVFLWEAEAFVPEDAEVPNVSIEGIYQGHSVVLRLLSEAPEDEEPGFELEIGSNSELS
jgi:hypothetical protein